MSSSFSRWAALPSAIAPVLPGILLLLVAIWIQHPAVLVLLLLAQAPLAAGAAQSLGYRLDQGMLGLTLRRGSVLLLWMALYASWVALVIGLPAMRLLQAGTMANAVLLSVGFLLSLVALIRLWPVFGLSLLWDDAYPESSSGSWIVTAARRVASFAWHLTGEAHEQSFASGIAVAFALLLLIVPAFSIAGLCGTLPSELRSAAIGIYALIAAPLAHVLVIWRTERLLLSDEESLHDQPAAEASSQPSFVSVTDSAVEEASSLAAAEAASERNATLLNAAARGNVEQVQSLLDAGADANVLPGRNDRDQRSPLMSAVCHSDLRLLRILIAHGANPDLAVNGMTPLLMACRDTLSGRAESVMVLLANGANLERTAPDGNTALHFAAVTRDPGIVAMLLDGGAPIDPMNAEGLTPLSVAARADNEAVLNLLLERGAQSEPARGLPVLVAAAAMAEDRPAPIKRLLKAKAAVQATDKLQRTALHVAALHGHGEIAELLINAGAKIDARDARDVTPLMEAARAGAYRVLQRLVFHKPDVHAVDGVGRTALHLACQSRQASVEMISALLGLGADPSALNRDGKTAVDLAAAAGRWQIVRLLDPEWPIPAAVAEAVEEASSELDQQISEAERLRLLGDALRCGRLPIARELLDLQPAFAAGVLSELLPICLERDQAQAVGLLLQSGLPLDGVDSPLLRAIRHTPLPLACIEAVLSAGATPGGGALLPLLTGADRDESEARLEHIETLALLMIERGADLFGADSQGRGLLHHAAAMPWPRLFALALARGLDPNAADLRGNTPLHVVVSRRHLQAEEQVRALLQRGADPGRASADGQTALGLALQTGRNELANWLRWPLWPLPCRPLRDADLVDAARFGDLEATRKLLMLGLDLNGRDAQGCTALLRAAGSGHSALVEWLLTEGADTSLSARTGATPLSAAVSAGHDIIVTRLIAAGAGVDQNLPGGITPLMIAAALGLESIVRSLLVRGAQANAVDEVGSSALHAAAQFAWNSAGELPARPIFEQLLEAGADINVQNQEGSSPLLLLLGARADAGTPATNKALRALIAWFLARGADIDAQDRRGVSVLHAAAMHGMVDLTETLLKAGADTRRTDVLGRNAHEVAVLLGYVDLAARLKRL